MGRRRPHAARRQRSRLPEQLRAEHRPVRLHRELPLPPRRPGNTYGGRDRLGAQQWDRAAGGVRRRRNGVGRRHRRAVGRQRAAGKSMHTGLLQPGGPGEREDPPGQFLLRQPNRIRRHTRGVAVQRRTRGLRNVVTKRYLLGRIMALSRRRPSPRVVIIGAGFGGLAAAVALRRRGIDDLTIIERSDGVGGTWRRNVYPGAACDIQSHLYSFSFAPNRAWSRTYAYQPEILAYLETVADDFDLRRHLMLGTSVRRVVWNEEAQHWDVELASEGANRVIVADVVVSAVGLFGAVRYPDIDGLADFSGEVMHNARWDTSVDLTGKRVAIVGTGASGVQVVPELAHTTAQLTVFQRTPLWMVPKEDRPYTIEELARFRRHPWAALRERWRLWKLQHDNTALTPDHPRMAVVQELSENFLRHHVTDEAMRDALTPRYPFRCKRVLLGEKYYLALQCPHVELVTDPIERVTSSGVLTKSGRSVDVDALVLATGFETSSYLSGL